MAEKKDDRFRNWTFLVYPESAPENWRDLIDNFHVQWACSPLHDSDINPDGTLKKPHFHVLLSFEGKKSFDQVKAFSDLCSGVLPIKVESLRGLVRYFAHLDNPEKYQYNICDIDCYGGFNVNDALKPTTSEKQVLLKEIFTFLDDFEKPLDYDQFIMYCIKYDKDDWHYLATETSTIAIKSFISARYTRQKHNIEKQLEELNQLKKSLGVSDETNKN